jgi:hypothetical protein
MMKNNETSSKKNSWAPNLCYACVQRAAYRYRHANLDYGPHLLYDQTLNSFSFTNSIFLVDHHGASLNYRNHAFPFDLGQAKTLNCHLSANFFSIGLKDRLIRDFGQNVNQQIG